MKKISVMLSAIVALMLGVMQSASAALPAIIGTTLDSVETDGLALADLVWPVVVTLFGAVLLFKLFKRFANKI